MPRPKSGHFCHLVLPLVTPPDHLYPTEIWSQCFGDPDTAILVLTVFHQRHSQAETELESIFSYRYLIPVTKRQPEDLVIKNQLYSIRKLHRSCSPSMIPICRRSTIRQQR
ncbi:uncharacterized protein METZ01_LOCUS403164 [marine metagenome]|uniref:Uncharacterized protein n=1 Tax=marine metagenome TaxID=408172 RepID=A0A382VV94_9ZZZZ